MDKRVLSQYTELTKEINTNQKRITRFEKEISKIEENGEVSDTVKGTRRDGTYGTIIVSGFPISRYEYLRMIARQHIEILREANLRLKTVQLQIHKDIQEIDNSRDRRLMQYRYIDGKKWEEIAILMNNSYDYVKELHHKIVNNP